MRLLLLNFLIGTIVYAAGPNDKAIIDYFFKLLQPECSRDQISVEQALDGELQPGNVDVVAAVVFSCMAGSGGPDQHEVFLKTKSGLTLIPRDKVDPKVINDYLTRNINSRFAFQEGNLAEVIHCSGSSRKVRITYRFAEGRLKIEKTERL